MSLAHLNCSTADKPGAQMPRGPSSLHQIGLAIIGVALFVSTVAAQPHDPPPAYTETIAQALAEFDGHRYAEARALFVRAHALYPNARTLRGLGVVEFELQHYGVAADYLRDALAADERRLDGEMRTSTEALLARTRVFLDDIELALQPSAARVLVDGVPVALAGGHLVVQVGDHMFEIEADGYRPERRALSAQGGRTTRLEIVLQPLASAAPRTDAATPLTAATTQAADESAASATTPAPRPNLLGVVLGGSGVAGLATAFGLWGYQLHLERAYRTEVDQGRDATRARAELDGFESVPLGVGAAGAALSTLALPWLLPEHASTPAWSLALGAIGAATVVAGTALLITHAKCSRYDVLGRCTDLDATTRVGGLLVEAGLPFAAVPVAYWLRGGRTGAEQRVALRFGPATFSTVWSGRF